MPVERRAPRRLLVFILAVPIVVAVYLTAFGLRIWSILRPFVAAVLGATVITSVYADEAIRRSPLPAARVTPLRAAAVAALAITLVGASITPTPTIAAQPNEAVVDAAREYLGTPYRLGSTGPRQFDCSGLVFRAFSDAGELPRVGGKRMRAIGYQKWFITRGLTSKNDGRRGDLVMYGNGRHIGIYLGDDRVLSALTTGVTIHSLRGINYKFDLFLRVDWSVGDGGDPVKDKDKADDKQDLKDNDKDDPEKNDGGSNDKPDKDAPQGREPESRKGPAGLAIGTMNLRKQPGPDEKIIGWVSRGTTFKILDTGNSPGGALWYKVESRSGKTGWVYSRWARPLD